MVANTRRCWVRRAHTCSVMTFHFSKVESCDLGVSACAGSLRRGWDRHPLREVFIQDEGSSPFPRSESSEWGLANGACIHDPIAI